jgi:hypothetical protein
MYLPQQQCREMRNLWVAIYEGDQRELIIGNNILKETLGIDIIGLLVERVESSYDGTPAGGDLKSLIDEEQADLEMEETPITDVGLLPEGTT